MPGAIAAVAVDKPIDVTDGLSGLSPLVYHFGHTSLRANEKLFTVLVEQLGESTLKRCEVDEGARHSGTIINLSGTASRVIVDVVREAFHGETVQGQASSPSWHRGVIATIPLLSTHRLCLVQWMLSWLSTTRECTTTCPRQRGSPAHALPPS